MSEWQPMSSAPKDRRILLRIKGYRVAVSGRWDERVELARYMTPPGWHADLLPWDNWLHPIEPDAWAELPWREDA